MVLERIYGTDFSDVSYGFRPGRSCHEALSALGRIIFTKKVNWISDADIRGFFDNVSHEQLVELLGKRLARFSLELAEEKTKLLRFGRFAEGDTTRLGEGAPGTFDFLGFTHYCGHSRAGKFKLKRKTATKKLRVKLRELKEWFRANLTTPAREVWKTLNAKLRGHYQYYGINDNWPSLIKYREAAIRMTMRWLHRRSQKTFVSWEDFRTLLTHHPIAEPRKLKNLIATLRRAIRCGTMPGDK